VAGVGGKVRTRPRHSVRRRTPVRFRTARANQESSHQIVVGRDAPVRYGAGVLQPTTQKASGRWQRLTVSFAGGTSSQVVVGAGATAAIAELWDSDWHEAAIIADANVMALYGGALSQQLSRLTGGAACFAFPAGESHKTRASKAELEDALLERGFGRDGCVVALGGGVSLDLGGFVAATYQRGVPTVSLPTSLLAQVDAALGGKTGVNTAHGKNLVGAFHHPRLVLVDTDYLRSLPPSEWLNGLAEMVKHAVVSDAGLFGWLEERAEGWAAPGELDPYPIHRCLEIKADIVRADERERGLRAVLSFGHTLGHALEAASDHRWSHGRAVAVGMAIEARIAERVGGLPTHDLARLRRLLQRLGLPLRAPGVGFERLCPHLGVDKKRSAGQLRLALPAGIGQMATGRADPLVTVPLAELARAWEEP
jgi:3-dehydroquinate synthase